MAGEILYREECYRIIGACFEVYNEMGCGFLEPVYQECLEVEFALQGLTVKPQADLALTYKRRPLKQKYIPDFILFDKIVLEIKSVKDLAAEHRAQIYNYLKATKLRLGLLVNFGHYPELQRERVIL